MTRSNLPPRVSVSASPGLEPPFAGRTLAGTRSASPLAVAYSAYWRTAPSEREVSLGVARVRARLHTTRRRFRTGSLLAFAVVFVGALAYAAGVLGGRPPTAVSDTSAPSGDRSLGARPERSPAAPKLDDAAGAAKPDPADRDRARQVGAAAASPSSAAASGNRSSVEPLPARAARSVAAHPSAVNGRSARGTQERTSSAAWAVVAESMAAKDYARAEEALRELASSDASETRNNARLGLAQLALGRGDCAEARRLAQRVLQGTPSAHARRRSEEVLARCAVRSSPSAESSASGLGKY